MLVHKINNRFKIPLHYSNQILQPLQTSTFSYIPVSNQAINGPSPSLSPSSQSVFTSVHGRFFYCALRCLSRAGQELPGCSEASSLSCFKLLSIDILSECSQNKTKQWSLCSSPAWCHPVGLRLQNRVQTQSGQQVRHLMAPLPSALAGLPPASPSASYRASCSHVSALLSSSPIHHGPSLCFLWLACPSPTVQSQSELSSNSSSIT